jgi:hypothetical protein
MVAPARLSVLGANPGLRSSELYGRDRPYLNDALRCSAGYRRAAIR